MALQKATVQYTKENGELVTRQFTIKSVVFHYAEARIETIYEVFPSEDARQRGAVPELMSQSVYMDMTDMDDITLMVAVSQRLWQLNWVTPFLPDYSETDERTGKMTRSFKSMAELGATMIDVAPLIALPPGDGGGGTKGQI